MFQYIMKVCVLTV
ncbi:hypothetical protein BDFB_014182 [Asbolus verrucosus]|uniref:Uncharacterized protein n=1 Tax=Asbolus verrucosus TaxID=1661398 RepID=A0A482VVL1_ASBVE|nr:hypothetical protein BDFB_014182 [Asbolus verrucosus]